MGNRSVQNTFVGRLRSALDRMRGGGRRGPAELGTDPLLPARSAEPQQDSTAQDRTMTDELLSIVAHELRNPLAPILTWTQLLRSGTLDREKSSRALAAIERSVQSQTELIDQLLEFSRAVSGQLRLNTSPVDLAPLIAAAAEAQRPAGDSRQVRLQLAVEERSTLVHGDGERLLRTMTSLISNAILSTPEGGNVRVVLLRQGTHVEISISDSGAGLAPSALAMVFEPIHPDTDGPMRRRGRLALGLSIARHVIRLHGGDIVAASGGAEQGSTFTVRLPVLTAEATARPDGATGGQKSGSRRLEDVRVLVVDSDAGASEALQAVMRSRGADVRIALSAQQGLETLRAWMPHVLVSGIDMGDQDGLFLVRELRKRRVEEGGEIPALALTGAVKSGDRVRILDAGYQSSLTKPADPNELVAVVESLAARNTTLGPAIAES